MPNTVPNATVSASDYVGISIPTNIEPSYRNEYTTPLYTFELGHNDILFETKEFNTSLKELMNRIYKLELDVYVLKQQLEHEGTIRL